MAWTGVFGCEYAKDDELAENGGSINVKYCNEGRRLSSADCGGVGNPPYESVEDGSRADLVVSKPGMIMPQFNRVGVLRLRLDIACTA